MKIPLEEWRISRVKKIFKLKVILKLFEKYGLEFDKEVRNNVETVYERLVDLPNIYIIFSIYSHIYVEQLSKSENFWFV